MKKVISFVRIHLPHLLRPLPLEHYVLYGRPLSACMYICMYAWVDFIKHILSTSQMCCMSIKAKKNINPYKNVSLGRDWHDTWNMIHIPTCFYTPSLHMLFKDYTMHKLHLFPTSLINSKTTTVTSYQQIKVGKVKIELLNPLTEVKVWAQQSNHIF